MTVTPRSVAQWCSRSGIGSISLEQLREQRLFGQQYEAVRNLYPDLEDRRLIYEIIRRMINRVVTDLIENSRRQIVAAAPASIDEVRDRNEPLISFSDEVYADHSELKHFLNRDLYRHEKVLSMTEQARKMLEVLFERYMDAPDEMSEEFSAPALAGDESVRARMVADYIAGMTDRFAIAEHERLG